MISFWGIVIYIKISSLVKYSLNINVSLSLKISHVALTRADI